MFKGFKVVLKQGRKQIEEKELFESVEEAQRHIYKLDQETFVPEGFKEYE